MSSFVNLLEIIYPIGSCYFSTNSTSPSEFIGGTWTKIENCVLAASGDTYNLCGQYSGNDTILNSEIPDHQHPVQAWNPTQGTYSNAGFWNTNAASGTLWKLLSFGGDTTAGDTGWNLYTKGTSRTDSSGNVIDQQKHIPYHYSLNVYQRIA